MHSIIGNHDNVFHMNWQAKYGSLVKLSACIKFYIHTRALDF